MYKAKTAAEYSQLINARIKGMLPAADPWIWPNNLYIVSKVFALLLRGMDKRLEWVLGQAFTSTASDYYLSLHGDWVGVTRRAPMFAVGTASAATDIGASIPAGTLLTRGDGVVFKTLDDITAISGETPLLVTAMESGRDGNTDAGAELELETPIAGVSAIMVDDFGLGGGDDEENIESFRARIKERKRNPPRGGTPAEYNQWARLKPGVTRVFVRRATPGPGAVTVFFMMDDAFANGIPDTGQIADLAARIGLNAPADADVVVAAPSRIVVDISISGLVPDTIKVREAVAAEINAMFRRRAEPGTASVNFIFSRSWIEEAISAAAGERSHVLVTPAMDVSCGNGVIAVPGNIAFT